MSYLSPAYYKDDFFIEPINFFIIACLHLLSIEIYPWSLIERISITFFLRPPAATLLVVLFDLMLLRAFYTASFFLGFNREDKLSADSDLLEDEPLLVFFPEPIWYLWLLNV